MARPSPSGSVFDRFAILLAQRLVESVSASPLEVERVSKEIAVAFADSKLAADDLRRRTMAVVANARRNPDFSRKLLDGSIAPSRVPFLDARAMATEERKAELDRLVEADKFRALSSCSSSAKPTSICPECGKLSALTFSCRAPAGNGGRKAVDAIHYTCTDSACRFEGTQT